jgi:uncharacterized membrane protein YeiH
MSGTQLAFEMEVTWFAAITFLGLHQLEVSENWAAIAGGVVVILTRVISIQFDLHLPKFKKV